MSANSGRPPFVGNSHFTFVCPQCKRRHVATHGDLQDGQIFDYECLDNESSQIKVTQNMPNTDLLAPTDGTRMNPMTFNPYSRRSDQYINGKLNITRIVGRNTREKGESRVENY